jgi:antitoxin component of MazEF toxin-antitoxin module
MRRPWGTLRDRAIAQQRQRSERERRDAEVNAMRALQKLVRNGNATAISIPRTMLYYLGWLPGESIILEVMEDKAVRVRRPCAEDFAPLGASRMLPDNPQPPKP